MAHCQPSLKISCKSVAKFLRKDVNRQTDRQTDRQTNHDNYLTSFAEVNIWNVNKKRQTRMWANAQRDGRPAEYRWRPLFNATKFG